MAHDPDRALEVAREHTAPARLLADLVTTGRELRYAWAASMISAGAHVLDIGCGLGDGAARLAAAGAAVVGVDRRAVVKAARTNVPDAVELVPGSLDRLPVADGLFDVVVCVGGLSCDEGPKAAVDELVRVVSPGGLLIVAANAPPDADDGELDVPALTELLGTHGFTAATYAVDAWLCAAIHDGASPITLDPNPQTEAVLVLASTSPLPSPRPHARVVTEFGVARQRAVQHQVAQELDAAHERVVYAERQREEVAALEARLLDAESELAAILELEVFLGAALEERDASRAERDAARGECDTLRAEVERFRAECDAQRAELGQIRAELDALRADGEALRSSTSWRVTAPGRWLSARARGLPHA